MARSVNGSNDTCRYAFGFRYYQSRVKSLIVRCSSCSSEVNRQDLMKWSGHSSSALRSVTLSREACDDQIHAHSPTRSRLSHNSHCTMAHRARVVVWILNSGRRRVGDQISESRDFPAVTFPISWRLKHAIRARAKFSSRQGDIPRICNLSPERRARASTKSQSWSV